ncbi:MAG: ATP-binding cassette domain-containing protein [Gammaproteobacteria bacterium]
MSQTPPIVLLDAVDVDIDSRPVLQAIDLALYPGQHMGIVGDNGSGKSTLLALIAGHRWPAPLAWKARSRSRWTRRTTGAMKRRPPAPRSYAVTARW